MTHISTFPAFAAQLREFIRCYYAGPPDAATGAEFNELALSLFGLQFRHNRAYQRFCEARKTSPQIVSNWREIPAMPAAGFKELELTSLPPEQRTTAFHSSGTTAQNPSRHFHSGESLSIYEASLTAWFRTHFPDAASTQFVILAPSPAAAPHSSLVHMFGTLSRELAPPHSIFTGQTQPDGTWNLDLPKTIATLHEACAAKRPVTMFGTAFNFVHLTDNFAEQNLCFQLPPGSCVLETGGYKSRSRVLPKTELHALITDRLGVPATHITCEYGMSELSSQAYDSVAGKAQFGTRVFQFPPWARGQIINPETGREAGEGETGLIRIFDLANVYSVMAVQTEDLGVRRGDGFELLGRAASAETRGCSLMSV
jgi:hypothetical protein